MLLMSASRAAACLGDSGSQTVGSVWQGGGQRYDQQDCI